MVLNLLCFRLKVDESKFDGVSKCSLNLPCKLKTCPMQAENRKLENLPYANQNWKRLEEIVNYYFWILFLKVYDLIANKYCVM